MQKKFFLQCLDFFFLPFLTNVSLTLLLSADQAIHIWNFSFCYKPMMSISYVSRHFASLVALLHFRGQHAPLLWPTPQAPHSPLLHRLPCGSPAISIYSSSLPLSLPAQGCNENLCIPPMWSTTWPCKGIPFIIPHANKVLTRI